MIRRCIRCDGGPITACMGFALARDILAATDGLIPWAAVREHCGRCAIWFELGPHFEVRRYLRTIPTLAAQRRL